MSRIFNKFFSFCMEYIHDSQSRNLELGHMPFSNLTTEQRKQLYEQDECSKEMSYEKLNKLASCPISIEEDDIEITISDKLENLHFCIFGTQ